MTWYNNPNNNSYNTTFIEFTKSKNDRLLVTATVEEAPARRLFLDLSISFDAISAYVLHRMGFYATISTDDLISGGGGYEDGK